MSNHSLSASIALCTYNGERFLSEQLQSFAAQTVLPAELVVCDDGSQDKTLEILEDFRRTAPFPVRIFRNETNLGFVKNFEKAVLLCEHPIIFLSDQDDVWLPEKVEKSLAVFGDEPETGLLLLSAHTIDARGERTGDSRDRWEFPDAATEPITMKRIRRGLWWSGCHMAFRSSLRDVLFPIPRKVLYHDMWILHLLCVMTDVRILKSPTDLRRLHEKNITRCLTIPETFRETGSFGQCLRLYYDRHLDPGRFLLKFWLYSRLIPRCRRFPEKTRHPEVREFFEHFKNHLAARGEAIIRVFMRPWIIFREIRNGNYARMAHPVCRILGDFLSPPFYGEHGRNVLRQLREEFTDEMD